MRVCDLRRTCPSTRAWRTGGARGLSDEDLARAYLSTVDPRLNYEQALEVAMRIARSNLKR